MSSVNSTAETPKSGPRACSDGDHAGTPESTEKRLPDAARRALEEAAARRAAREADIAKGGSVTAGKAGEIGGPAGPEPTRYGDWETKGRASDF